MPLVNNTDLPLLIVPFTVKILLFGITRFLGWKECLCLLIALRPLLTLHVRHRLKDSGRFSLLYSYDTKLNDKYYHFTNPFLINNDTAMVPSAVFLKYSKAIPKEMSLEDIQGVQKAFADAAGRAEEIRPCVACSQGCTDELFNGRPVSCIGNARAGFEGERVIQKTTRPKQVMVVGAGVAGLEAAITAKQAGHWVEIYEKTGDIGGQIWIAAASPHKLELLEFIRYYRVMVEKYEIPIHFHTCVDLALIKKINPDHLIIAQGAAPLIPPIDGTNDKSVRTSWEVLKDNPCLGKRVI